MLIRSATAADVDRVTRVVRVAYSHYISRIGRRPRPMDADYARLAAEGKVWIAENHEIVGVIVLSTGHDYVQIENLAVDPSHQGQGTGQALLTFAEQHAARLGLSEIRLYTHALMTENRAYYQRRGFSETDHRIDDGLDRVFFARRLNNGTDTPAHFGTPPP
jgi:ribosomal protein S18 acetylase RimI-like enzyme